MTFGAPSYAQDAAAGIDPTIEAAPGQVIDGFRSARFGMDIEEIRSAIAEDFGIEGDEIAEGSNTAERTQVLSVVVPDLLPEGGTAQVSYVFGYRSGGLIQVGISWDTTVDPDLTDDTLYANADVLVSHFLTAGYLPESVRSGVVVDNGVLVFRGEDAEGHATILLLQGEFADIAEGQQALVPTSLALLYAADAENPDVFRIEPGQF